MDKDYVKGLKHGFGILTILFLGFGIVFAVGFHSTSEILPGIFSGNYEFSDNLTLSGKVNVTGDLYFPDGSTQSSSNGTWELIKYHNASSDSTVTLGTVPNPDNYEVYKIIFLDVIPSIDDNELGFRWGYNSILSSNYAYEADDTAGQTWSSTTATQVLLTGTNAGKGIGSSTYEGASGIVYFYRNKNATYGGMMSEVQWHKADNTGPRRMHTSGSQLGSPNSPNNFQFLMISGGNIDSGRFYLYGLKK